VVERHDHHDDAAQEAAGCRFGAKRRSFASVTGETFSARGELPEGRKIVYKMPHLARADPSRMNEHERDLGRSGGEPSAAMTEITL
jgi:hypothetical protein